MKKEEWCEKRVTTRSLQNCEVMHATHASKSQAKIHKEVTRRPRMLGAETAQRIEKYQ